MNYKDTLLMPETSFQMRGNLPENEKLQREKWEEMDLYNKIREKNKLERDKKKMMAEIKKLALKGQHVTLFFNSNSQELK